MKAYQLKIAIKNSKPPIWRRCIVPAGITFSQLSIILNKVMGWSGYHLSEFEFYHLELQLREDDGSGDFRSYGDFDLLDSSKTYINEYMEQQEWFTYAYDFGDDWQHRVTIEAVLPDYPYPHPQVLKYKGDCPVEDCGGIDGYYEFLSIMNDKDHPEHEERKEWAAEQGYGREYDMDEVNRELREACFVTLGKGDKRSQREIYEDMLHGKKGLAGSKTARNKEKPVQSSWHEVQSSMKKLVDITSFLSNDAFQNRLREMKEANPDSQALNAALQEELRHYLPENLLQGGMVQRITLAGLLNCYTKEDLSELADLYQIPRVSSIKKTKLISAISERLLEPDTLSSVFASLSDGELEAFERASEYAGGYPLKEEEEFLYDTLSMAGYVGLREDDKVEVPEDVIEAYHRVNTDEFQARRKRIRWLIACFDMAVWFYGAVPVDIMVKVVQQGKGMATDKRALISDYESIPGYQREFSLQGDRFIYKDFINNPQSYKSLRSNQRDKDYYIPSESEILDISEHGFLRNDLYTEKLLIYFVHHLGIEEEDAIRTVCDIQHSICFGCEMSDIFDLIEEDGIYFKGQADLNTFIPLVNNLWNNTRMILNRGHKPIEILKKDPNSVLQQGKLPTVVPVSNTAAKLLQESKEEIEKMGFSVDLDASATEIPVFTMQNGVNGSVETKTKKVYPNDPCPCGSGKKYKKCCGRQENQ